MHAARCAICLYSVESPHCCSCWRHSITITLQRLAGAFDLLDDDPPDLSGLHILICGKTALDSQGTLCLDAAADMEDWAAFLGGLDPDWARERKAAAAALRGLEGRVAAAVGVRMLFTAAPYLMTHEYRWVRGGFGVGWGGGGFGVMVGRWTTKGT